MTYIILPNAHLDATAALLRQDDNGPYIVSLISLVKPGQQYIVLCLAYRGMWLAEWWQHLPFNFVLVREIVSLCGGNFAHSVVLRWRRARTLTDLAVYCEETESIRLLDIVPHASKDWLGTEWQEQERSSQLIAALLGLKAVDVIRRLYLQLK